jgi:putative acetyltransferase
VSTNHDVLPASKYDYPDVMQVWEASVRATHDFLSEEDIEFLKPLILNQYLDAVTLRCIRDDAGRVIGFLGVAEGNIEMLFVDPAHRGQSVGKRLLEYAVQSLGSRKVDVNEQNSQAVGFYEHMGFEVVGRSPLDGQDRPFPLLHMRLRDD